MKLRYPLLLVCLIACSCSKEEAGGQKGQQASATQIQYQYLTDSRYFSKPVALPSGEVTDEQRVGFANEMGSAIDETKTNMKEIAVRAEAPGKVVIALYANNVTREMCESLRGSEVIQRAAAIGFRTFSCQDRTANRLFSIPIGDSRGEIQIINSPSGIKVAPVR